MQVILSKLFNLEFTARFEILALGLFGSAAIVNKASTSLFFNLVVSKCPREKPCFPRDMLGWLKIIQ